MPCRLVGASTTCKMPGTVMTAHCNTEVGAAIGKLASSPSVPEGRYFSSPFNRHSTPQCLAGFAAPLTFLNCNGRNRVLPAKSFENCVLGKIDLQREATVWGFHPCPQGHWLRWKSRRSSLPSLLQHFGMALVRPQGRLLCQGTLV